MEREDENLYKENDVWYLDYYKKRSSFVSTHLVYDVVENKAREMWIKEDNIKKNKLY